MNTIQNFIRYNDSFINPTTNSIKGILLHSSCKGIPSTKYLIKKYNNKFVPESYHGFIDWRTGEYYNTLPYEYSAKHGGDYINQNYIGIMICEPDYLNYTNDFSFDINEKFIDNVIESANVTYQTAINIFAELCVVYSLNPLEDEVILSHSEATELGIISTSKYDPEHFWNGLDLNYDMDQFRQNVNNIILSGKIKYIPLKDL